MIVTEAIPPILTWPMIRDHVRLAGDDEKAQCLGWGLAAAEAFEHETGIAAGIRTITVQYDPEDIIHRHHRHHHRHHFEPFLSGVTLDIPKGPVVVGSAIVTVGTNAPEPVWVRKIGHSWSFGLLTLPSCGPIVLTYSAGFATVPALVAQACLIHVETMYRNRGATSTQSQSELAFGLERIYQNFRTFKALAG